MIRGVKFVSVPVVDQDRALAFYTERLGFRVATVVLFRMDEGQQPGGFMNMSLWTDDVRTTAKTLKERGVEFVAEPKKEEWGVSAIFKDSEGNRFVLSSR